MVGSCHQHLFQIRYFTLYCNGLQEQAYFGILSTVGLLTKVPGQRKKKEQNEAEEYGAMRQSERANPAGLFFPARKRVCGQQMPNAACMHRA
jgi:hypothetical protein